ncbi:MAG: arginine--tRNA ligase [Bacteroidales bacterium]|jgi:arginyl-tRNA synthetase|nr:arginine--tRNA ligase [Bacteroidales bacterium]
MNVEAKLKEKVVEAIQKIYGKSIDNNLIQIQRTRKDFEGDYTLVVFSLLRISKRPPEQTANEIGEYLKNNISEIKEYNIIKGFLNLSIDNCFWIEFLNSVYKNPNYGIIKKENPRTVMIEYSSPNTNKPLHLGHIRNNLLGFSVAKIIEAIGDKILKVNLVNDRGIHICKSMLAWQKWGNNDTPEKANKKGDHFVGDYYVKFDQEYKKQISKLIKKGQNEKEAKKNAPLIIEAQEMLLKWEKKDTEVIKLWKKMNSWVLNGFDITYKNMGVDFDKVYFESDTYKLGKSIVLDGVKENVFCKKDDNSIWLDLTDEGLDQKLLLRSDGTSVYMTQDIGTAIKRFDEYNFDELIYVVGNEQNYHFQVLKLILSKLDCNWAENIFHLSYGMVELPEGKMKSREGTVVDADDLMDDMINTASLMSEELGKLDNYSDDEKKSIINKIGIGALKYFILKVDPKTNMTFNPKESIYFTGNTGPFIQYSYTRIQSLLKKADEKNLNYLDDINVKIKIEEKEIYLIKLIHKYPDIIIEAANTHSPAIVANYAYNIAKEYNQFYHDYTILKETRKELVKFRLVLSKEIGKIIASSMNLLGISMPERM